MPLIHEDKVVTLEGIDGHSLLARCFAQFMDIDDIYAASGEQRRAFAVVKLGLNPGKLELLLMLARESFVRRQQDNPV